MIETGRPLFKALQPSPSTFRRALSVCRLWLFRSTTIKFLILLILTAPSISTISLAQPAERRLILENVQVSGTERLSSEQIMNELGLIPLSPFEPDNIQEAQLSLLSLGLFKSATLSLKKGSKPGRVILVVELVDDPNVLGDWAFGSLLGIFHDQPDTRVIDQDLVPVSLKYQVLARNLLSRMHRASLFVDIDSKGIPRHVHATYGLPRFLEEKVQFDGSLRLVQPEQRYLEVLGFAAQADAIWTYDLGAANQFQYGVSVYSNQEDRFVMPGYPEIVAGPKVSFLRETRFLGFLPSSGYSLRTSALLPIGESENLTVEVNGSFTQRFGESLATTFELEGIQSGSKSGGVRLKAQLDWSLLDTQDDHALLFIQGRHGYDQFEDSDVYGTEGLIGIRYHSQGFIAELGFKITSLPKRFDDVINPEARP